MRLVARSLTGAYDFEASSARPIYLLADQRRLIAPGERIDDAGVLCAAREQGTGDRIGLDVDHHDMLAVCYRLECVNNPRARHACGLDDDLDLRICDEGFGIVGD